MTGRAWKKALAAVVPMAAILSGFGSSPDREEVTVGCVNCGEYEYVDGQTSAETYAANWKRLYAENPADVWFKEDTVASRDPNLCLEAVTASPPLSNTIVELVGVCPEGKTERRYARRLVHRFGRRTIAFYGLHLVAEGHVSKVKGADGRTPSQRLRQRQFAGLIEDARQFDGAVFGDDYPTRDGTCIRDYVHLEDLASAHILALEKGAVGAFNLGTGHGISVREIVEACRKETGHPIPVRMCPRRPGDPAELFASGMKARRELGWNPFRSDVETIVRDAWAFHRTHPNGLED